MPPAIYSYSFVINGVRVPDANNPDLKSATESLVTVPGAPAMPWELRNVPHGNVTQVVYQSAAFNAQRRYFVYTPPGYETGQEKYPVFVIPPNEASAFMGERLGLATTRAAASAVRISRHTRVVAKWIFPLPVGVL